MAGKITTNSVVLGDSVTDTQNFVLKTNADGTATLARGALGGLGTVLTVDASSNVTLQNNISVGGAAPTTSGTGITFPATQSASSNANTLDDYEEGTWTPTLVFSGGAGTLSYSARVGTYTKVGSTVFFNMRLVVNKGTAAGALDNITGLPFAAGIYSAGGGVYIDNCSALSGGCQYTIPAGATLYVYMSATGTATPINVSSMGTTSTFTISGFYIV